MHISNYRCSIKPCLVYTLIQYFFITDCGSADIVFLLDSSGSVGSSNFQKQKDFIVRFAQSFDIGPNKVQIGVETFSSTPHHEFNMNTYHDTTSLVDAIHRIGYHSGGTRTDLALKYVEFHSFNAATGDRLGVRNILIVMTDGLSNAPSLTYQESVKLHQRNVKIFAIGIGSGPSRTELGYIASDSHHVFSVNDFNALSTLLTELKNAVCKCIMRLVSSKKGNLKYPPSVDSDQPVHQLSQTILSVVPMKNYWDSGYPQIRLRE